MDKPVQFTRALEGGNLDVLTRMLKINEKAFQIYLEKRTYSVVMKAAQTSHSVFKRNFAKTRLPKTASPGICFMNFFFIYENLIFIKNSPCINSPSLLL